jgi:hypothetical protein
VISRAQIAALGVVGLCLLLPAPALGAADLSATMTAEPNILPLGVAAQTVVTLTVANGGPDNAAGSSATLGSWEPQLSLETATPSQGAFANGRWEMGTVPASSVVTLALAFDDAQSGRATPQAQVTTETAESSVANNSASTFVDVLALVLAPELLAFSSQTVGVAGTARPLTLSNYAAVPIQVGGIQLAGADFAISTNGCTGTSLAPEAACQVALRFAPTALGDRTGTLIVSSSTTGVSPLAVPLTGTGIDETAASLKLKGVPKTLASAKFKKGFSIKVTPSERVALDVALMGKARNGALASAFDLQLFSRHVSGVTGTKTIKVKPKANLLGPMRKKFKVSLKVETTDAAGNRSTANRTIKITPSHR